MGYLLAAGCSWTDAKFKSGIEPDYDCSFPKWPDVVAKDLGIKKVVNIGLSGASNNSIFEACYDQIIKAKPDVVCILLTSWYRHTIFNYNFNIYGLLVHSYLQSCAESGSIIDRDFHSEWADQWLIDNHAPKLMAEYLWHQFMTVDAVVNETLRNIFLFQSFCDQHNIKFIIAQGLDPVSCEDPYTASFFDSPAGKRARDQNLRRNNPYAKCAIESNYSHIINDKNLVGWPFFDRIGGTTAVGKFIASDQYWSHVISKKDGHPNAMGHRVIADMFVEGYNSVYKD